MNAQERISYIIERYANGQADFSRRCSLPEASVSRLRTGKYKPSMYYYNKILNGFPDIRKEWLINGEGVVSVQEEERGNLIAEIRLLRKEVRELSDLVRSSLEKNA